MDPIPNDFKLIFMSVLTVFALIFTGIGCWLTKKAIDTKNGDAGFSGFLCFVGVAVILVAIGHTAGIQLK